MSKFFELACSNNKKGAFRIKRDATTQYELADFVKEHKDENCYLSVYQFTTVVEGKPLYETAIVDKLFCELDGPDHGLINTDVWNDLRRIIEWCRAEEAATGESIKPQVFFSGSSGYHLLFKFGEPLLIGRNNKVIQKVVEKIRHFSGSQFLDLNANKGYSQLRRIPNTLNHKSGFYCIPLTIDEAYNFPPDRVLELARKPRRINNFEGNSDYFVNVMKHIFDVLKKQDEDAKNEKPRDWSIHDANRYKIIEGGLKRVRPCIFRIMKKPNPDFSESTWIACELIRCGYTDRDIYDIFKNIRKTEYNHDLTSYQVKKLRDKGISAPTCRFLEEKDYCKEEYHHELVPDRL